MPALVKNMQITIIDNSDKEQCDPNCGVDWRSRKALDLASQRIKERFGGGKHLEYFDLSTDKVEDQVLEWIEVVKGKNLRFPALLINGQPRIAGQFDIRQLLDVIEAEMEMGGQRR